MSALKTMFQLTGRGHAAANLSNASLLIIDAQNEYLSGPLALTGMEAATANIALLLEAARKAKRPVVHVRHLGTVGGMFDPQGHRGEFIAGLEPIGDEVIIEKRMPNAFNDTGLQNALEKLGPGLDRLRLHEPLQRQHHRARGQRLWLSLHLGRRRLRHP